MLKLETAATNNNVSVICVTLWMLGDISPKISSWSPLLTTDQSGDALTHRDAETGACGQSESGNTCRAPGSNNQQKQWSFSFVCHPLVPFPSNRTLILFSQPLSIKIGFILNPVVFENIYVTFTSEPSAVSRADSNRLSSSGPPPPPCRVSRPPTPSSAMWT